MKLLRRILKILSGVQTGAEHELGRLEHFAHFCVLVAKSFVRNRCPVRAAALSFTTLLALIPMLAVAISVTSSLLKKEGEDKIYVFIDKMVSNLMPPATLNTNSGTLALNITTEISFPLKPTNVVTSANLVTNTSQATTKTNLPKPAPPSAENGQTNSGPAALNAVPKASPPLESTNAVALASVPTNSTHSSAETDLTATTETLAAEDGKRVTAAQKKAAEYIHEFIQNTQSGKLGVVGMLLLVFVAIRMLANIEETFNDIWGVTRGRPWMARIILYWATITLGPLLLAGALGLASSPHFIATKGAVTDTIVGGLAFQLLPLIVLWLAFALAYQLVPNSKINFSAAVVGGIVGGTLWHLNGALGFLFVSRADNYSKVYQSLGLVPVFMVGLYFSWLILLFGAQVAYAFQNRRSYLQDKLIETVSQRGREFIALRLMTCIGQRFNSGQPPLSLSKISLELGVPSRLVQQVLQPLLTACLVVETGGTEPGYSPARPLDTITAYDILHVMRTGSGQELTLRDGPVRAEVYGEFARIEKAEREAAASLTMLALVSRAQARLELIPPEPEKQISAPTVADSPEASPATVSPLPDAGKNVVPAAVEIKTEIVRPPTTRTPSEPKRTLPVPDEEREFPL